MAAWHGGTVRIAKAQDEAVQSDDDGDIAAGEMGSEEDDTPVPTRRRAGASVPRFVLDPSARVAVAHKFSKLFSAELYGRAQLGAVTDPLETRASKTAGGLILNTSLDGFVWSNSVELAQHQHDFFGPLTYDSYEPTTALARPVKFSESGWSLTPRISYGYLWATDNRFARSKTELMTPVTYKLTRQLDLTFTPRVDYQVYTQRPDGRRDWTGYFALGFKYDIVKGINVATALGYETRSSNVPRIGYARWKLAPSLNLRAEF